MIIPYRGSMPQIAAGVFLAPTATVIGDVHVGAESGLWFGVIVRGDVNQIRIGCRSNLQDGTIVHVTSRTYPTRIGDSVTVGHGVRLHGCTIGDGALIGIVPSSWTVRWSARGRWWRPVLWSCPG